MRKIILSVLLSLFFFATEAQSEDTSLNRRLADYMRLSEEMRFDELMDYIHPKLFQVAPKKAIADAMRAAFESEEIKISMDSMRVVSVEPLFRHENVSYRKIGYSMVMELLFIDTSNLSDSVFIATMNRSFSTAFPGGNVRYDEAKKAFVIGLNEIMVAIKDNKTAPWLFIGYKKDHAMNGVIFPKAVLQKFGLK